MTYAEKLKDPRWQKKRLEIMQRDEWECRGCHDKNNTLNVHHLKYINSNEPWDYPDDLLITLCEECHEIYHLPFDILNNDAILKIDDFFKIENTERLCKIYFKAIENHEGNWILYTRDETDLNDKYKLLHVLHLLNILKDFIQNCDCNISINNGPNLFDLLSSNYDYYGKTIH